MNGQKRCEFVNLTIKGASVQTANYWENSSILGGFCFCNLDRTKKNMAAVFAERDVVLLCMKMIFYTVITKETVRIDQPIQG